MVLEFLALLEVLEQEGVSRKVLEREGALRKVLDLLDQVLDQVELDLDLPALALDQVELDLDLPALFLVRAFSDNISQTNYVPRYA